MDALPPAERATSDRQVAAADRLLDPTTPPAGIVHAAAVLEPAAGTPTWETLDALAVQFAGWASQAETRG